LLEKRNPVTAARRASPRRPVSTSQKEVKAFSLRAIPSISPASTHAHALCRWGDIGVAGPWGLTRPWGNSPMGQLAHGAFASHRQYGGTSLVFVLISDGGILLEDLSNSL